MSVLDNICIAAQTRSTHRCSLFTSTSKDKTVSKKAEETLSLMGLEGLKCKLAGELSHGDQRRLEIGMSLAIEPELLLLDEPTSGMSPLETQATVGLIKSLSERVTICFIEHKMNLVMTLSDKIIVLNLGEKVAEGDPHAVASNKKVQEVYLGTV
jgi:branched-chain amino acid transport system ATP-binding protein